MNISVPGSSIKSPKERIADKVGTTNSIHEASPQKKMSMFTAMSNKNINTSVMIKESNTVSHSNKKEDTTSIEAKVKLQIPNIQDIVESANLDSPIFRKEEKATIKTI